MDMNTLTVLKTVSIMFTQLVGRVTIVLDKSSRCLNVVPNTFAAFMQSCQFVEPNVKGPNSMNDVMASYARWCAKHQLLIMRGDRNVFKSVLQEFHTRVLSDGKNLLTHIVLPKDVRPDMHSRQFDMTVDVCAAYQRAAAKCLIPILRVDVNVHRHWVGSHHVAGVQALMSTTKPCGVVFVHHGVPVAVVLLNADHLFVPGSHVIVYVPPGYVGGHMMRSMVRKQPVIHFTIQIPTH